MSQRTVHDVDEHQSDPSRTAGGRKWKVVTASVTGRAHAARGQGNEDATRSLRLADGTVVLALADGAGSANRAAEGATLAVEAAIEALGASLTGSAVESGAAAFGVEPASQVTAVDSEPGADEELAPDPERARPAVGTERLRPEGGLEPAGQHETRELSEALLVAMAAVRRALAARVRELRQEARATPRELSSTLLLAILRGDTLAVLQLGDGAAVAGNRSGWRRVTRPLRGRHAGETVFVTSRGARELAEVEVCALAADESLALLSDGLEPVATDMTSGEPHAPFFDPLATFAGADRPQEHLEAELEEFLGSERVQSRSSDDLSLILAVRQVSG